MKSSLNQTYSKVIVIQALSFYNTTVIIQDNLEAARKIEGDASAKFGGRFNAIVSDAEFAYVNWYGKRNCQLRIENRHSLTWED